MLFLLTRDALTFSTKDTMYFDRIDVCSAWFLFLEQYHEGQGSDRYARLCRLTEYFKPSPLLTYETMGDNAQAIFHALISKEYQFR